MTLDLTGANVVYLDIEGKDLCRDGAIYLMQVMVDPTHVYLVDFVKLKDPFALGLGFREIMENQRVRKVFFDPRNDCDALWHQYSLLPVNVLCLQMAELVTRFLDRDSTRLRNGMKRVLGQTLSYKEASVATTAKEAARSKIFPECGGSFEAFAARPMEPAVLAYCVTDVVFMPKIKAKYFDSLPPKAVEWTLEESTRSTLKHRARNFQPRGRSTALAPLIPSVIR
ncbi:ribonuclease H-like domain-containing protein [Blastocladiella britannica]|nr:ribonuclease H-like domain-containing protein [Blastocladiella britannica]